MQTTYFLLIDWVWKRPPRLAVIPSLSSRDFMSPMDFPSLNHLKIFDLTLTFSEVNAPINLDIYVAIEVAIIAKIIS